MKTKHWTNLLLLGISASVSAETFHSQWDALTSYQCPEWFQNAKFGIYAHWGPYSASGATGNTDWYGRNMYEPEHPNYEYHVNARGPTNEFGYKDLIPLFSAENFDADEWADLYVEAGAQFAGPVGEHADGFAMWDSDVNPWNAARMGPKRDVVAEMEKAIRKRGLKFLVSMHHHWLWGWYPTWKADSDCANPEYASFYGPVLPETARARKSPSGKDNNMSCYPLPSDSFQKVWLQKVEEVVSRYHPDILWFDNRMQIISEGYRQNMVSFYYRDAAETGYEPVLTYKRPDLPLGTATIDLERSRMPDIYPEPWLTDTSISRGSWAYATDLELYDANRVIDDLVDIVSKNGCLLLNIAPKPDGTIPEDQKMRLLEIGKWLKINGEAIYETRPWLIFGEGITNTKEGHLADVHFDGFGSGDIRFTTKGDQLYAIALGWPDDNVLRIEALSLSKYATGITSVELFGHSGELKWNQNPDFLEIFLPNKQPCEHAFVFKINR